MIRHARSAISRMPCCLATALSMATAAPALAATMSGIQLKAQVADVPVSCMVAFDDIRGSSVDFGKILSSQLKAASHTSSTALERVFSDANFNGVYDNRQPLAMLKLQCNRIKPPSPSSFQIQFGASSQHVAFSSSTMPGFRLESGTNQDKLAFSLYARDSHSAAPQRINHFVKGGDTATLQDDSFQPEGGGQQARIELFPALYWIGANRNATPGVIKSAIHIIVTLV